MMKKSFRLIIGTGIFIVFCLITYSHFNVTGNEIIGVSKITLSSNIVIKKSYLGDTKEQEFILNANQIEMLKSLILQSDFTRNISTIVKFNDEDMYSIVINDNEAGVWLIIDCIGNEWISVANQFNGKHLKVNNPNWKSTLEEILMLSK